MLAELIGISETATKPTPKVVPIPQSLHMSRWHFPLSDIYKDKKDMKMV